MSTKAIELQGVSVSLGGRPVLVVYDREAPEGIVEEDLSGTNDVERALDGHRNGMQIARGHVVGEAVEAVLEQDLQTVLLRQQADEILLLVDD